MLDPKEVRKRLQEAELMEESKKVFQWILELLDNDTKTGYFGSITVWQYDNTNSIDAGGGDKYEQCIFARDEIFPIICEVINNEEGYHAEYNPNAVIYDEDAWSISVTAE